MTFIDAEGAWVTVDLRENQLQNIDPGDTAHLLFDAVPGRIFAGRVQSIAWGINPGRNVQGGLVVSQPSDRWFEPTRRIPVRMSWRAAWKTGPARRESAARLTWSFLRAAPATRLPGSRPVCNGSSPGPVTCFEVSTCTSPHART